MHDLSSANKSQHPADSTPSLRPSPRGALLFAIYLTLYSAFVLLNAFAPATMQWTPFAGINLAVLSGLGLIVAAFLLALIYDWFGPAEGGR